MPGESHEAHSQSLSHGWWRFGFPGETVWHSVFTSNGKSKLNTHSHLNSFHVVRVKLSYQFQEPRFRDRRDLIRHRL